MQKFPLDTPHQPLLRGKELGDCVCDNFKLSGETNTKNKIAWLPLMTLNKVVKVKDELRDLDTQLKYSLKDLNVSTGVLLLLSH